MNFEIRIATMADIQQINSLIKDSASELSKGYYNEAEISALNKYVFGVDTSLIKDQTYYVAELDGMIVACGGWSKRATMFGGDQFANRTDLLLNPDNDAAKLRAFFCHPNFSTQGLSKALMQTAIASVLASGFTRVEGYSTLTGLGFYKKLGGEQKDSVFHTLPNGMRVELIHMEKDLGVDSSPKLRPKL